MTFSYGHYSLLLPFNKYLNSLIPSSWTANSILLKKALFKHSFLNDDNWDIQYELKQLQQTYKPPLAWCEHLYWLKIYSMLTCQKSTLLSSCTCGFWPLTCRPIYKPSFCHVIYNLSIFSGHAISVDLVLYLSPQKETFSYGCLNFQTEYSKPPSNILKELSSLIMEILVIMIILVFSLI